MIHKVLLLVVFMGLACSVCAQDHRHGEGQLLISQEENHWAVQLILPAADVFGFEHTPETQAQKKIVTEITQKLKANEQVVHLDGQCVLNNTTSITGNRTEKDHHAHHNSHGEHHNIEFLYDFTCESDVTQVSVGLFNWVKSLSHLEAQWFHSKGQGAAELTRRHTTIRW